MSEWTSDDIPDQTGRTAVVTGANSGIGYETARQLAHRGADVVLACRSEARGREAVARIEAERPRGRARFAPLDLADLDSVAAFAEALDAPRIDRLINNAGVMMPPLGRTAQGFELQIGVNHLGHFALTGRLLPRILAAPGSRVVSVSSQAHRQGAMDFDDLQWERRRYSKVKAYGQSKLANLLFTFELQRRLEAIGADALAVAAHPGWTGTNLQRHVKLFEVLNDVFAMSPGQGAQPTLRAATDPAVTGGDYFGPDGLFEMRGNPTKVGTTAAARDADDAATLWSRSEALTGVRYDALARSVAA
ncbi:MAG TPA: oxidoreductase [Sandaracinaceae bacterium LLY-WYZ-13_1]|nr:oxidoreductase [Sandaracinaceae bacterium LLY-WYZ-13_1]